MHSARPRAGTNVATVKSQISYPGQGTHEHGRFAPGQYWCCPNGHLAARLQPVCWDGAYVCGAVMCGVALADHVTKAATPIAESEATKLNLSIACPLDTTFPGHALFCLDCGDSACRKI